MHADGRADNPFESVLRAIAIGVAGLSVEPQVRISHDDFYARVDLADEQLRIVLEADSFEFHGERRALATDCRRYDELVARGWVVLRFAWEQVMFEPAWVASVIRRVVEGRLTGGSRTRRRHEDAG
jgi:very-short-patch-repair endonuclease